MRNNLTFDDLIFTAYELEQGWKSDPVDYAQWVQCFKNLAKM